MASIQSLATDQAPSQEEKCGTGNRLESDVVSRRGEPESLQDLAASHEIFPLIALHAQERDCRRAPVDGAGAVREEARETQPGRDAGPSPRPEETDAGTLEGGQLEGFRRHAVATPLDLERRPANPAIQTIMQGTILEEDLIVSGGKGGDPTLRRLRVDP